MVSYVHEESDQGGTFYILESDNKAGEITYVWAGDNKFIIDHTQTYEEFGGKGYGRMLVNKIIDYAITKEVKILPLCPYARRIMESDKKLSALIY